MNAGTFFPAHPMYPWRFGEFDNVMDDALDIALDYLIRTDHAVNFRTCRRWPQTPSQTPGVRGSGIGCGLPTWLSGRLNTSAINCEAVSSQQHQARKNN